MEVINDDALHSIYSSSASMLAIMHRYDLTQIQLSRALDYTPVSINRWTRGKQPIGILGYKRIMKVFPEFINKVDYDGVYVNVQ
jgi:hypothetical protein